jgi:redox-sensitive bicupin YhaK (pirin superfamily)
MGDSALTIANAGTAHVRVVVYAGERQDISIVSYGPFIGETTNEIERSIDRYRAGTFRSYTS